MSKSYIVYNDETGEIVSVANGPNTQLIPEGPAPYMPGHSILHGTADIDNERVEHGKVVPLGKQMKHKKIRSAAWFTFRKMRRKKLEATDVKMNRDYPLSEAEEAALRKKRQESRDIPNKTDNPYQAIEMLNAIWDDTDT